jgi:hypothetical protein
MAGDSYVPLGYLAEASMQVRQQENRRTADANTVFLIASAVLGIMTPFELSRATLPPLVGWR